MMVTSQDKATEVFHIPLAKWVVILLSVLMLIMLFYDGLAVMFDWWLNREEYSHGIIIPFISAFLIWQRKDRLAAVSFESSWLGVMIVAASILLFYLGELSGIYTLLQYSFLLGLYGIVLSITGWAAFRIIWVPLAILIFMLPLPNYLYNNLSSYMQLVSTDIGVWVIRLFDISVYQEGNVIDLGLLKLQVVDACSGLRYLFPLMTLSFIAAYMFRGAMWKRAVIFISSIPITVLMNSLRIGLIGVSVEYWGIEMAEGVLHDFEGWVMFMSCVGVLILEMWFLAKIGKERLTLQEAFGLDFPEPRPEGSRLVSRKVSNTLVVSMALLGAALLSSIFLKERQDVIPDRIPYSEFPLALGDWKGRGDILEQIFVDKLKLTDYALIDFRKNNGIPVNFYSAYYASQRKDSTTHSPRACLPGGGWEITDMHKKRLPDLSVSGQPLVVNRVEIEKDDIRQLVYYWFQQRGRIVTNETMVKYYFFEDSLKLGRTDGALIRLTTYVPPDEEIETADKRLQDFLRVLGPIITDYVPD